MTQETSKTTAFAANWPRVYYGWYVVFVLALVGGIAYGAGVYAFTLFMPPLSAEFGWSRGAISSSISLFWLSAPLVPLIGAVCEKVGPRRLILIGAVIEGVGLILTGFVTEIWQLYLLRVAMGVGKIIMVMPIPIVLCKWFCDRYSTALGVALAGWHVGGLALTPLAQHLIDAFTWRVAAFMLGGSFFLTVMPAVFIVLRVAEPSVLGLAPDGLRLSESSQDDVRRRIETVQSGDTFRAVLRRWIFWVILMITGVYYLGYLGVLSQESAYLQDLGVDSMVAAGAVGSVAAFAAVGVIMFGALLEKRSVKSILVLVLTMFVASLLILDTMSASSGVVLLYAFTVLFGLAVGAGDVIWMTLLRACFGNRDYGTIFGVWYFVALVAMTLGPIISGYIYDATNSYEGPLRLITGSALACVLVVSLLPIDRKPDQAQSVTPR